RHPNATPVALRFTPCWQGAARNCDLRSLRPGRAMPYHGPQSRRRRPPVNPTSIQLVATVLFAVAVLHTFSTKYFQSLADRQPAHSGMWHLLAEVEVVFGFWAMVFIVTMMAMVGTSGATEYVESRNFTEPMFVFVIMVIAGTRPIVWLATRMVDGLAKLLPWRNGLEFCFSVLALVPLLGSFITEPAAMTLADRKSTRLNSSHVKISYAVFCLK